MTVSEALCQTWGAVVAEASQADGFYHRRVALPCPWPAHAGVRRPDDTRLLILETDKKALRNIRLRDETRGYAIDIGADAAGRADRASIRVSEVNPAYREVFTVFCGDLLEHWCPHASASDAVQSLHRRLNRWRRFFQRGASASLSREDYIGLFGELSFIEECIGTRVPPITTIGGWRAPSGTNQDFQFGTLAVEVKTATANDMNNVRVANIRQLDPTGLDSLFLARFAFDFREGSGRTLPQLVSELKASLAVSSADALNLFSDRLLDAGFVEGTSNEFDAWGFTPRQHDFYEVDARFPRLLESALPAGVSEVSYTLNLSAATHCRINEVAFWSRMLSTYA